MLLRSVQVARFLFIDYTRKGRGKPPKIVEPLKFALLRYSLNSCLHRRYAVGRLIVKMNLKSVVGKLKSAVSDFMSAVSDFFKISANQVSSQRNEVRSQ